jgi:hypothetical protein
MGVAKKIGRLKSCYCCKETVKKKWLLAFPGAWAGVPVLPRNY